MTIDVTIGEAGARLSELVAAALSGEELVLQEDGKPQVRLAPLNAPEAPSPDDADPVGAGQHEHQVRAHSSSRPSVAR